MKKRPKKTAFPVKMQKMLNGKVIKKIKKKFLPNSKIIKIIMIGSSLKGKFVMYNHSIGEMYNNLTRAEFFVEKIIEPDSRKKYSYDSWYGLWDYKPKLLKMVPPTIIFKARKRG